MLNKKRKQTNDEIEDFSDKFVFSSLVEENKIYCTLNLSFKRTKLESKKLNAFAFIDRFGTPIRINLTSSEKVHYFQIDFQFDGASDVDLLFKDAFFLDIDGEVLVNSSKTNTFKIKGLLPNLITSKVVDMGKDVFRKKTSEVTLAFNLCFQRSFNQYHPAIVQFFKFTGFVNLGKTCYMNCFLQMINLLYPFKEAIFSFNPFTFPLAKSLQQIFTDLSAKVYEVNTSSLFEAIGWNSDQRYVEHDIHEFSLVISSLFTENGSDVFNNLFAGKVLNIYKCSDIDFSWEKQETIVEVSLPTKGFSTLVEALRHHTHDELLETKLDTPYGKQTVYKQVKFATLPKVLSISLKRFEYCAKRNELIKLNNKFQFPEILDLSEFSTKQESSVYVLHGVIVHSDSNGSGHYFCYLRPSLKDEWFLFNDKYISPVGKDYAIRNNFGGSFSSFFIEKTKSGKEVRTDNHPTLWSAYLLVYVKQTEQANLLKEYPIVSVNNGISASKDIIRKIYVVLFDKTAVIGRKGYGFAPSLFDLNEQEPFLLDFQRRILFSCSPKWTVKDLKLFLEENGLPQTCYKLYVYNPPSNKKRFNEYQLEKPDDDEMLFKLICKNSTGICYFYMHSEANLFNISSNFNLSNDYLINRLSLNPLAKENPLNTGCSLIVLKENKDGFLMTSKIFETKESHLTIGKLIEAHGLEQFTFSEENGSVHPLNLDSNIPPCLVLTMDSETKHCLYIRCIDETNKIESKIAFNGLESIGEIKQILLEAFYNNNLEKFFQDEYYLVENKRINRKLLLDQISAENVWINLKRNSTNTLLSVLDLAKPEIMFKLCFEKPKAESCPVDFETMVCSLDSSNLNRQRMQIVNPRMKVNEVLEKIKVILDALNPEVELDYYFVVLVHDQERFIKDIFLDQSMEILKFNRNDGYSIRLQPFDKAVIHDLFSNNFFKVKKIFFKFQSRIFSDMVVREPIALFANEDDSLNDIQSSLKKTANIPYDVELIFYEAKQENNKLTKGGKVLIDDRIITQALGTSTVLNFIVEL